MCEDQMDENEYAYQVEQPALLRTRYDRLRPRRNNPTHKQVPLFINGEFTTVDKKLHKTVRMLNAMGMTTRFSCQGTKPGKKSRPDEDKMAYIMFEGESAHLLLFKSIEDFFMLDDSEYAAIKELLDEVRPVWFAMCDAKQFRDNWDRRGINNAPTLLLPAWNNSKWVIEHDVTPEGQPYGHHSGRKRTTLRFPREDLKSFEKLVEMVYGAWIAK